MRERALSGDNTGMWSAYVLVYCACFQYSQYSVDDGEVLCRCLECLSLLGEGLKVVDDLGRRGLGLGSDGSREGKCGDDEVAE